MTGRDLTLAMRLLLDSQRFVQGLTQSSTAVGRFTTKAKSEFSQLRDAVGATRHRLAAVGIGLGATAIGVQSARLDKSLEQIGLTAGVGREHVSGLRRELFALGKDTGQQVEDLQQGFSNLIAGGLDWRASLEVIRATNKAMAVTTAQADALTGGLSVAATAFDFDLSQPRLALDLLDKMTVAGRLGNAELESLSSIFSRVGVNSRAAGLAFDQTLAFIEGLSLVERQPEKLATLADSTLRIFTNAQYRRAAERATGVRFFDSDGSRRDAMAVLDDLRRQYAKLNTDAAQARFVERAFGKTDADTLKGLRTLLSGEMLPRVGTFTDAISQAAGTLERDLDRALSNSVDQAGRLKAGLRDAADDFVRPFKWVTEKGIKLLMDERGGLGLEDWGLVGAGTALFAGGYLAKRFGGPLLSRVIGGAGSTAMGIAAGKAIEQATGVTPVFVTNWPGTPLAGSVAAAGAGSVAGGAAAGALTSRLAMAGKALGAVSLAGAAGYGAGTLVYNAIDETSFADKIGAAIAHTLALFGNDTARESIRAREQFEGSLKIQLEDKRTRVTELRSNSSGFEIGVMQTGAMFSLP